NVDYNDLKRFIKIRTTRGQGEALLIPGLENEAKALKAFENEFYHQLTDQHQRVDLFVQSKAGEINRRLIHLDKQVGQLQQRYALHQPGKISVKRLERYSRAEEAAEKAGEEIKSLARFVGAQKLAFIKLLKKYRKWTRSSTLESRFRPKVLDQPTAFSNKNFEPLLTQYTEVLAAVRAPFEQDGNCASEQPDSSKAPPTTANGKPKLEKPREQRNLRATGDHGKNKDSIAAKLQMACQSRSDIEFDTALAIEPTGSSGEKASYWIHPDNLVELHVLLLQYSRMRRTNSDNATPTANGSKQKSRKESTNGDTKCLVDGGDDDAGLVICDDLEEFARRRSAAPIGDSEESTGRLLEIAAASARYSPAGDAVLAVNRSSKETLEPKISAELQSIVMKRKAVRYLFDSGLSKPKIDHLLREAGSQDGRDLEQTREWLTSHREVQPLVQLQSKRTRFVGLRNNEDGGTWATLDRDTLMRKTPEGFFSGKEGDLAFGDAESRGFVRFPFAVLEVRSEGGFGTDLVRALDRTHLTERMRGFSIEAHAVATLCKPQGMPAPYWLPALSQDLRKLPATVMTAQSRQSRNHKDLSPLSTAQNSTSATSNGDHPESSGFSGTAIESSATSVPELPQQLPQKASRKKRRLRRDRPLRQPITTIRESNHQRYWNEYDDGDENSENEPFAIYIDPNQSSLFPGFLTISKAASSLASKAKSRLYPSHRPTTRKALDETASPEDDSDPEDSPIDPLMNYHNNKQNHYSTFQDRRTIDYVSRGRELLLTRSCIAFYVASSVLLIVAAILASSGRRKAHFEVDVGVIIGVTFSLVFAVAGVGCVLTKKERVGGFQRVCVFGALTVVCACSGILLGGVVDG
ncbi:MAG: hypothetical protein Q9224_004848, partial [Gallowayella concinna]